VPLRRLRPGGRLAPHPPLSAPPRAAAPHPPPPPGSRPAQVRRKEALEAELAQIEADIKCLSRGDVVLVVAAQ
jgi:hypothetical protein